MGLVATAKPWLLARFRPRALLAERFALGCAAPMGLVATAKPWLLARVYMVPLAGRPVRVAGVVLQLATGLKRGIATSSFTSSNVTSTGMPIFT
jgi:hypothetical protein